MFDLDDTIAAIASAPGGALRGIVRLSGPDSIRISAQAVCDGDAGDWNKTDRPVCMRAAMTMPRELGAVPVVLYLWPTAKSFTRQPSAEWHLPGSPPVLAAALERACQAGARLARPGEFTLRAFLAGRLDLTQAEAVLGVIDAENGRSLDAALAQLAGGLSRPLAALRERLLDLLAQLEAGLDFVDEDIEFISREELDRQLAVAADLISDTAARMQSRGEAGQIPRVVLMGAPNAGKSSLLNALAGHEAAIVSEIAGTTRDFVTRRIRWGDRDCLITDTAGLWPSAAADALEEAGQAMTQRQIAEADVAIVCLDASGPLAGNALVPTNTVGPAPLLVWTKCDLPPFGGQQPPRDAILTSSRTGQGLAELQAAIVQTLSQLTTEGSAVASTADRCRESLRRAGEALRRGQEASALMAGEELIAAEVRVALDELGQVVGAVYTDDVLDRVFSRFCIGK